MGYGGGRRAGVGGRNSLAVGRTEVEVGNEVWGGEGGGGVGGVAISI